jgi:glycosyltransferase involved in cell wall biosynthesis
MANVLFACSAERGYIRNRVLVRALRRSHKVRLAGSDNRRYPVRLASVIPRILTSTLYDYHFAGFLGQPLVPFMWARGMRPLVLDAFVSVYDTLVLDRGQHNRNSPVGRVTRWLDSWSMRRADLVLTDTPDSAAFMASEFGADQAKLVPVPVGADESVFYPRATTNEKGVTTVLYISTYLPLHGVGTVVEAANELRDAKDIRFVLAGTGPERSRVDALAREYALDNLRFIDWVDFDSLPDLIASCDVFLGGHFSHGNEKARRVVPGKVFQGLAMARPVILGDCEGNRQWFTDGDTARIVPMADPSALANVIRDLAADAGGRKRLAESGRALYESEFSEATIAALLDGHLADLQAKRARIT